MQTDKELIEKENSMLDELAELWEDAEEQMEVDAENFWNSLSYEDKLNAFYYVTSKLKEGELTLQGSYRYILYEVFNFEADAYALGMASGFMELHNAIMPPNEETR